MTRTPEEQHAMDDDATVFLMQRTSIRAPRQYLTDCAGCQLPFWAGLRNGDRQRYCSNSCRVGTWRLRHLEAARAQDRARYHARRRAA